MRVSVVEQCLCSNVRVMDPYTGEPFVVRALTYQPQIVPMLLETAVSLTLRLQSSTLLKSQPSGTSETSNGSERAQSQQTDERKPGSDHVQTAKSADESAVIEIAVTAQESPVDAVDTLATTNASSAEQRNVGESSTAAASPTNAARDNLLDVFVTVSVDKEGHFSRASRRCVFTTLIG